MSQPHWILNDVTPDLSRFRVFDSNLNKSAVYFIPKLMSVKIDGHKAIICTKEGKRYLINLNDGSRQIDA